MAGVNVHFDDSNMDKFYGVMDDVKKLSKQGKDWDFNPKDFNEITITAPSALPKITGFLDKKNVKYSVMRSTK